LEQIDNELRIHCPNPLVVRKMTKYLTFFRPVTEKYYGYLRKREVEERCYRRSETDPFLLSCSAGFESMICKKFKRRFRFTANHRRDARITANTQANWLLLDDSQLRNGQKAILAAMVSADQGRIVLPPSVGKSYLIGCYITLMPQARIIISTKNKAILFQLHDDLNKLFPDQVGLVCSGKNKKSDSRIVCVSQGTLDRYFPREGDQNVDVLIVDEYHEWGSNLKLKLLSSVKQAKLFGLSGNKYRDDGAEFQLDGIFGPVLAEMTHAQAVDKKLVTPICVVWVPVQSDRTPIRFDDSVDDRQRYGVWQYDQRNRLIAESARMFNANEQVLISVRTIEHALHLRQFLPEFTPVYAAQDGRLSNLGMFRTQGMMNGLPDMTEERLIQLKKEFETGTLKKVIATNVWAQGVNFPSLAVVIRADGMDSMIADVQWPGRTSRLQSDKPVSLVFDFTDEYDTTFRAKAIRRHQRYAAQQWEQITLADLKRMM
jgi:superfamily II DNA or RNA helicase